MITVFLTLEKAVELYAEKWTQDSLTQFFKLFIEVASWSTQMESCEDLNINNLKTKN